MLLRSIAARIAMLFLFVVLAAPGRAADFVDSTERYVALPDRIERVMPANQSVAVLVFVLAPEKLLGWSEPLMRAQHAYLPAKFARLPVLGQLIRSNPGETVDLVSRMHPDLIIDSGPVSSDAAARADWVQQQTRVPYIFLDGGIQQIPDMLSTTGALLGVTERGQALAYQARLAIDGVRGRLLIKSATDRPLVYYGRGADGLETGLGGSPVMADIDQAGVVNVAASLGQGERTRVTREQIIAWKPGIVIAQEHSFYNALLRNPAWRGLPAVANKRIYLAPSLPFSWIDDPPGVNRIIGLAWLSSVFYPDAYQEDLGVTVHAFYESFYGVKVTDRQLEALLRTAEAHPGETRSPIDVPLIGAEPVPLPNPAPNAPSIRARPPGRGGAGMAPGLPNPPNIPGNVQ